MLLLPGVWLFAFIQDFIYFQFCIELQAGLWIQCPGGLYKVEKKKKKEKSKMDLSLAH